jgi:exonuclease SbcC
MIKSIRLINFQAHEDTEVQFGRITTIVSSENDVGKTTLLRALEWVATNRGKVKAFLRLGAPYVEVILKIGKHIIVRHAGDENYYQLDGGKKLRAFGSGVPDSIAKILNVGEANFQGQLDAPYWFLDSPGRVAKNLNKIINLEVIDRILHEADSNVRKARAKKQDSRDRLAEAKEEKNELSWVKEANDHLGRVISLQEAAASLQEGIDTLERSKAEIEDLERSKHGYKKIKQLGKDLIELERLEKKARRAGRELKELESLLAEIEDKENESCQLKEKSRGLGKELKKLTGGRCPLCGNPIKE